MTKIDNTNVGEEARPKPDAQNLLMGHTNVTVKLSTSDPQAQPRFAGICRGLAANCAGYAAAAKLSKIGSL
jgi:hypothetical protein